jgi:hypothetical protein
MSKLTEQLAEVITYRQRAEQIDREAKQPVIDKMSKLMILVNDVTNPDVNARCGELEGTARELITFVCSELDIDERDLEAVIGE